MRVGRDPWWWWHGLLVFAVSSLHEMSFLVRSFNVLDEGWPLYAAQRLHHGGVLYQDILFIFPPGHLLPAWLAYGLDPPGVFLTRVFYAAFMVALCLAFYALGRRLMKPSFALLGALLLAVAAPYSHNQELLFGYRYLVFSALGLIAFARRLETGDPRWLFAAGAAAGVALCFRLTPAFAQACGIGVAVMAASRSPRAWLEDWARFAIGLLAVAAPVVVWFGSEAGFSTLWVEVVERAVLMTVLQSVPMPDLALPAHWDRSGLIDAFVPVLFRLPILLYAGYLAALAALWARAVRQRRAFPHVLLLAVAIWAAVFFLRSLGRADLPHLESALPPFCLVAAHLLERAYRTLWPSLSGWAGAAAQAVACSAALALWIFLLGSDRHWSVVKLPVQLRNVAKALGEQPVFPREQRWIQPIQALSKPGDTILDMSAAPILYVMAERLGPGYSDILMPGTFRSEEDEAAFLERVESDPPQLVIYPVTAFDGIEERAVRSWAPRLTQWVHEHYVPYARSAERVLGTPRRAPDEEAPH